MCLQSHFRWNLEIKSLCKLKQRSHKSYSCTKWQLPMDQWLFDHCHHLRICIFSSFLIFKILGNSPITKNLYMFLVSMCFKSIIALLSCGAWTVQNICAPKSLSNYNEGVLLSKETKYKTTPDSFDEERDTLPHCMQNFTTEIIYIPLAYHFSSFSEPYLPYYIWWEISQQSSPSLKLGPQLPML